MVVRDIGRGAAALMIVAEEITVGAATEIIAVEYRGRRDGRLTQHHYPHSRVLAADSGAEGRSAIWLSIPFDMGRRHNLTGKGIASSKHALAGQERLTASGSS